MIIFKDNGRKVNEAECTDCGWSAKGSGAFKQAMGHSRFEGTCKGEIFPESQADERTSEPKM